MVYERERECVIYVLLGVACVYVRAGICMDIASWEMQPAAHVVLLMQCADIQSFIPILVHTRMYINTYTHVHPYIHTCTSSKLTCTYIHTCAHAFT